MVPIDYINGSLYRIETQNTDTVYLLSKLVKVWDKAKHSFSFLEIRLLRLEWLKSFQTFKRVFGIKQKQEQEKCIES
jgi:hypothetical protein